MMALRVGRKKINSSGEINLLKKMIMLRFWICIEDG